MLTPGGENFRIGRDDQNTTSQQQSMGLPGATNLGNTVTVGSTQGDTKEFVNKSSKANVWGELEKNVKALMTDKGTVMVSEMVGTITVRDRADRIELIAELVNGINKNLVAQVLIQV